MDPKGEKARLERVGRLLAVARRLADPAEPLGREARGRLARHAGLSAEGISLALTEHLERSPSPAELERLLASMPIAERCHVVLASNVCTAALRALACAIASAPAVTVRASRRDPVLAELLVRELAGDAPFWDAGGSIALVTDLHARRGDVVHAYGSDETLAALADRLAPGVRLWRHGTGIGLALVAAGDRVDSVAEALARDVVPFDQRGCLSPRFVLCEGDPRRGEALGAALHEALTRAGARVPRGPLARVAQAELSAFAALARGLGPLWQGDHHLVALDPTPTALWLAPPARVVPVVACEASTLPELLGPWARFVAAVGAGLAPAAAASALATTVHSLCPSARRSALGQMQRPPLDGPVDLRREAPR